MISGTVTDAGGGVHGFLRDPGGAVTIYDHPGATRTRLLGINDAGDAAGFWFDGGGIRHGYVLSGGVPTEIDVPGATGTGCTGLNHVGQIVGFYRDGALVVHGFLLDHGAFTTIDFPGSFDTRLTCINNGGVIIGTYDFFSFGMIAIPARSGRGAAGGAQAQPTSGIVPAHGAVARARSTPATRVVSAARSRWIATFE